MERNFTSERTDRYEHAKREKHAFRKHKKIHRQPVQAPSSFLGMPCEKVEITIPTKAERREMRRQFEMETRAKFVKFLARECVDELRKAGITNKDIKAMTQGKTPNGWNTHHKKSIYGGGTNDFSNLLLIRRKPYHDMMHYHLINPQLKDMSTGDTREIVIPNPDAFVFIPQEKFRHLERDAKRGQKSYGETKKSYCTSMNQKDAPFMQDLKTADAYVQAQKRSRWGR